MIQTSKGWYGVFNRRSMFCSALCETIHRWNKFKTVNVTICRFWFMFEYWQNYIHADNLYTILPY